MVKPCDIGGLLSYLKSIEHTMSFVDDYITIKNTCDQVVMKTKTIKSFQHQDVKSFHNAVLDIADSRQGMSFLICKN